jgi:hypothetical protein
METNLDGNRLAWKEFSFMRAIYIISRLSLRSIPKAKVLPDGLNSFTEALKSVEGDPVSHGEELTKSGGDAAEFGWT